jgi:hypothetical protein
MLAVLGNLHLLHFTNELPVFLKIFSFLKFPPSNYISIKKKKSKRTNLQNLKMFNSFPNFVTSSAPVAVLASLER